MSWTSYVEKSGSGTGVIIDKCTEHGLARPEFDPTSGFFKIIIWRNGSIAAKRLVAGTSRGLVKGPSRGARSRDPVVAQSNGPVVVQSGPSRGTQSGPSRGIQSIEDWSLAERIVLACEEPKSVKELLVLVGRTNRTKFKQRFLGNLRRTSRANGLISPSPSRGRRSTAEDPTDTTRSLT